MKTLVTGGAGFVGSYLVERLLRDDREVVVLDDLSTGSLANLAGVRGDPRLQVHVGTILDEDRVAEAMDGCGAVFHLAAAVGVQLVARDPAGTLETNVRGAEIVACRAAAEGARLLLASSSEVYGKGTKQPLSEDQDLLLGPTTRQRWSYACSKAAAEHLTLARAGRIAVVVARLFNTVGPRQTGRFGMVLPRFVEQGLEGRPITVFASGEQRRCFADVREVVDCLVALSSAPEAEGQVFNVGNDREVPIQALAELVRERTGGRSEIVNVRYEAIYGTGFEDLERRIPDLTELERAIGRRPLREIDAIVDDVVAHARAARSGP